MRRRREVLAEQRAPLKKKKGIVIRGIDSIIDKGIFFCVLLGSWVFRVRYQVLGVPCQECY